MISQGLAKQALPKARKHLCPGFIHNFAGIAAKEPCKPTCKGMAPIAISGSARAKSSLKLPRARKNAATALAPIAYDPLKQPGCPLCS